jgi:hypothetical protein
MDDPDSTRSRPGAAERVPGLSPVRAFFLLAAVAAVIPLGIFATRDEAAPSEPPAAVRSPDYSLTDAEAVAEFERLNEQLMEAYRERDITLAEQIFTSDSPMLPRVRKEIRQLVRSSVVSLTHFELDAMQVLMNAPERIVFRRAERLYPRFRTDSGDDATGDAKPERRTVQWEMRQETGLWLLHNAVVVTRHSFGETRS